MRKINLQIMSYLNFNFFLQTVNTFSKLVFGLGYILLTATTSSFKLFHSCVPSALSDLLPSRLAPRLAGRLVRLTLAILLDNRLDDSGLGAFLTTLVSHSSWSIRLTLYPPRVMPGCASATGLTVFWRVKLDGVFGW